MSTDVEAAGPVLTVPGAPVAFHVMAKPTGAICNLDCEYCFFLSREMLYPGSRFRMAEELQETYIRQLIEAHARAPEVVVAWQGGEPTIMGLEFFRRSVKLRRRAASARRARDWPRADRPSCDAKRGRNEPCTCGNGRKWKHCHGRMAARGGDGSKP